MLPLTSLFLTGCADSANKRAEFGADADDVTIASRVKAALLQDIYVGGFGIDVQSHGGHVRLGGFVPDKDQRRHLEAIARSVQGVESVENNIHVREGKNPKSRGFRESFP